jgi:DNA-binding NtrC family response regulator
MARVLCIDDDSQYLDSMTRYLGLKGHQAKGLTEAPSAMSMAGLYDIVLLDINLGIRDGFSVLDEYAAKGIPVAMVSGMANAQNAVRAIRAGAIDVLDKPVDPDRLEVVLAMAEAKSALARSERAAREAWLAEHLYVGDSLLMKNLVQTAEKAATTNLAVLLQGPSGSGKEPLARWIYVRSHRCQKPFVAINCAAIPAELAESELFGHKRGAFTGADRDRTGYFAAADGGTLFLDEIGELPLTLQSKLLRAIETGEYRPVGADTTSKADVRIISATNRDLQAEVEKKAFREDLLYRLGQVPLAVPPLSSRRSDIAGLVAFFIGAAEQSVEFTDDAIAYLANREYPGNVRELKNLIERAIALCGAEGEWRVAIDSNSLASMDATGMGKKKSGNGTGTVFPFSDSMPLKEAKRRMELAYIERQIELAGGSIAKAAQRLDILPNNLSRRLGELRE